MGYRSNLTVLIYPETGDESNAWADQYSQLKVLMNTQFREVAEEFRDEMKWRDDKHTLIFEFYDVKWYDSYADVIRFNAMMEAFENDIPGYCTEFVRVGEDYADIETRYTGNTCEYRLGVSREIAIDL
jgi:hypothetical protein